tara:strand:+ start:1068 stop:3260 length:2193 start_codon:yes stop_codon:yes gene_type:complete
MTKKIYRILIALIIFFIIILIYLSTVGIKTDKFNSKIITQVKKIEPNLELKLSKVSATLNPFKFEINAKTIGTDLIYQDKVIKLESIKSNISLKSVLNGTFAITGISISTKSLVIKDLFDFARLFNNDPKFYIAKQFIKKGYLVGDLRLEFDEFGNIKNNYNFNGLVREGKISLFKKYNLNKIDFIFKIDNKDLIFNDIKLLLNNNDILIPELIITKKNKDHLVSGIINTTNTSFLNSDINNFINDEFLKSSIKNISFSSKNNFKFKINRKFKIKNLDIKSNLNLNILKLKNSFKLKDFFPEIKKDIIFKDHKIKLEYKKDNLSIDGEGEVLLQNKKDKINYEIYKIKNELKFDTILNISNNPFEINFLNYKKDKETDIKLSLKGKRRIKEKLIFDVISLKEKDNIFSIKNLVISKNNKINDIENININYIDKYNFKNNLQITKKNQDYLISGKSFNIDYIVDKLINSKNNKKLKFFDKNFKFIFDIKKIYLDEKNNIDNLKGFLSLNKNEISELNLESKFSNLKNIKLTIKDNGDEKITTLFSHEAKPLVDRYKFIKGFEEGDLDFYSIKKNDVTNSTLKIDNFKIQEIPVLAKLLTLASLQGIADLLTGEGIRFTDFEMKFSNKGKLMTIKEIYAIGPAISILMDGYIEKDQLISLRGTLVPATTVNRTISSIPIIGDILVGKKVGEGVFGVSFKIKGPPKDLETTVNPIKTLTPRFITRTLEKIKKN